MPLCFSMNGPSVTSPLTTEGPVSRNKCSCPQCGQEHLFRLTGPSVVSGEVTEGPFMLKHKGIYYLTYSGTGADSPNYGIGYATSKSPTGPFVKYAGNPIAHRGGKVLGPGHHCVVEGPDGKLWLVYHQKWNAERNFHQIRRAS